MNYNLVFHTHVETDINEAYDWYENKQAGLGERLLTELIVCYNKLEAHPELFSKTFKGYRKLILSHFPYIIVYEIIEAKVFIYAVFHTSRHPKEILTRRKSI